MLVYGKCECFVMQMLYVYIYVHRVAVLNTAFCMAFRLLMLVDDARGDLRKEPGRWRSLL